MPTPILTVEQNGFDWITAKLHLVEDQPNVIRISFEKTESKEFYSMRDAYLVVTGQKASLPYDAPMSSYDSLLPNCNEVIVKFNFLVYQSNNYLYAWISSRDCIGAQMSSLHLLGELD